MDRKMLWRLETRKYGLWLSGIAGSKFPTGLSSIELLWCIVVLGR